MGKFPVIAINRQQAIDEIRSLTASRGTKSALARALGVSRQTINNWVAGRRLPSEDTLQHALNFLRDGVVPIPPPSLASPSSFKLDSGINPLSGEPIDTSQNEDLAATISDGISRIYKECGARVSAADLGRLTIRIFGRATLCVDVDKQLARAADELRFLRERLLTPVSGNGSSKRSA